MKKKLDIEIIRNFIVTNKIREKVNILFVNHHVRIKDYRSKKSTTLTQKL